MGKARFPSGLDKSRLLTARASALPAKLDKRVRQAVAVGELASLTDSDSDCKNEAVSLLMLSLSIASCVATAKAATAIFNGISL